MKGLLKLIAGLVACIVVVIVAGGAILGALFDPNEYKPEIEQAALENGGIELKINGDIGWSVFPWLGLEVNKIDVNFPGKQKLASLNQAQISVRLPALISGQVEMQSIVVDGLQLNLVKEQDGATNWAADISTQSTEQTQSAAPEKTESHSNSGAAIALNIDSIQITNGLINYLDKTTETEASLSNFNMTSGQVVTNAFFPAQLSFKAVQTVKGEEQITAEANLSAEFFLDLTDQLYKIKGLESELNLGGKPFAGQSVMIKTAANIEANLVQQALSLEELKFSLANLKANGSLAVNNFAAPEINGQLSVAAFDLNQLLLALGQPEVKTTDPEVLKAISFNTELAGPANTVTAKSITLKLDDTSFNGSAAFNLATGNFRLNLLGDKLNADRYTPPAQEANETKTETAKPSEGYPKDPILPIDVLRGLNLDVDLGLTALHVANLDVSNLALQVNARDGLVKLNKIDADLYSGTVRNKVTVDVRKDTPVITSKKTIKGIQVGDMLMAAAKVDQLTGELNSSSNITLRGNSVHDFVNSMTGKANFNMKDGEVKGIDMAQTVCQGLNNISSLGVDTQQVDRSTPFANLGASANIKNGVVSNQDLKAALDAMTLSGKGTVNLPKQALNYRLGFMVEKNLFKETCSFPDKLEGVEVPIDCKGAFSTPPAELCKPDFGFIKDAIKKEAKAKVEEKIKGKLEGKLKGLFGR